MKKSFKTNLKMFLIIFTLIVLFPSCIHSMQKQEEIPSEVIIGGELLQINMDTKKVMYYKRDSEFKNLENFDLICKIDNKKIKNRNDIFNYIIYNKAKNYKVLILRNGKYENMILSKEELNPSYFTEYIPFCATLTYIDPKEKTFGAVGHNIKVNELNDIISKKGKIYLCNVVEIKKSNKCEIGSIYGKMKDKSQGNIYKVNDFGAKGKITCDNFKDKEIYEVGKVEDVRLGHASLVINNSTEENKKFYDINITKINNQDEPSTQGFEFEVVDKEFINSYGGILQGMSGSPIIQNGKIVGALSHVLATNTKEGIGLYIEWMMEK